MKLRRCFLSRVQVAVRVNFKSGRWLRGRVCSVMRCLKRPTLVSVFLVDYGQLLTNLNGRLCLRALPLEYRMAKPSADRLVLAGIRPLAVDLDCSIGMNTFTKVSSDHWSGKALETVKVRRLLLTHGSHNMLLSTSVSECRREPTYKTG
jgi:hypothetical protein